MLPDLQHKTNHRNVMSIALVFALGMAGTTLPTPLYPLYRQTLGLSHLMVALVFASYAFAVLAALIATGPWSDQVGRKPMLAGALATSVISSILFLLSNSLELLLVARVFSGLSAGLFTATATAMIVELAPAGHKQRAAMIATIVNMGGLGLGPLLAGAISEYAPWPLHSVYAIHAMLMLASSVLIRRCPETVMRPPHPKLRRQGLGVPAGMRATFILAAVACFAAFALLGLLTSLEPAILGKVMGISNRAAIGALVFMVFAASLAGQAGQRALPDRVRWPVACAALAVGAGFLAVAMALGSTAYLLCGALIAGLGHGGIFVSSIASVTTDSPQDKKAEVTALLFVVIYLAVSLPVLGLGIAIELIGLQAAGVLFALLVLLLSLAAWLASWHRCKHGAADAQLSTPR
ncbi:MFS transporter [Castellaniella sp.]|uniref:MFS transporter n=1 Tax=Castellaniella sp. TaxID=1955812 RepID=UPI003C75220C